MEVYSKHELLKLDNSPRKNNLFAYGSICFFSEIILFSSLVILKLKYLLAQLVFYLFFILLKCFECLKLGFKEINHSKHLVSSIKII